MKLSIKIFLSICIPVIVSIAIVSTILIQKNYKISLEQEIERSTRELGILEKSITNTKEANYVETKYIVQAYANYYRDKEITILYYENGKEVYKSHSMLELADKDLLNVSDDETFVKRQFINQNQYLYISTKIGESEVLIYVKNIQFIYETRSSLIKLDAIIMILMLIGIAIIAYYISNNLTQPLKKMKQEIERISKGDFKINLKEDNSEFGKLASSFNQMSRELENRDYELVESARNKQIFIDNLSHEINTPLTSILGYAELLEKVDCSEDQKISFLRKIQEQAKAINDIHKKLLLLSYKENADFEKNNIDVNKMLEKITQNLSSKIIDHRINLIIQNKLDKIYGDETLITICISNLISNAIHASKDGSKIVVNTLENSNEQLIEVIDEGIGISKENIEKIVEPFYRVDKARSRKNGGAGLRTFNL